MDFLSRVVATGRESLLTPPGSGAPGNDRDNDRMITESAGPVTRARLGIGHKIDPSPPAPAEILRLRAEGKICKPNISNRRPSRCDGDGLRTLASTGTQASKKTLFDWDPNAGLAQIVAERDGNAALVRRYRQGQATVSMDSGGSTFYFAYDGLGSVVNLTNASGATQWTYAYLPYGGVRTETKNATQAPPNVLRFTGQILDPTGLYQLRARSYDPGTGQFISTDPLASSIADALVDGAGDKYADSYDGLRRRLRRQPLGAEQRRRYIRGQGFGGVAMGLIFLSVGLISLLR
jgi:RHS repeat-associated protein